MRTGRHNRRHRPASIRHAEDGVTLIEVLVAIVLLLIGVIGTIGLVDGANAKTASTSTREAATGLARHVVETSRTVPYHQLQPSLLTAALEARPGLGDGSAVSGWNVRRRGVTFTLTATVCTLDDPVDGGGRHDAQTFCEDSTTGSVDPNGDDYKRVAIEVAWSSGGTTQRLKQATLVVNPGQAAGPSVRALAMASPLTSPVTAAAGQADFTLTTSWTPAAVRWSVDGVSGGTASGSGTNWSFSWPIQDLADGTYLVAAEALDSSGAAGASQSLTVALNRFIPAAPTGFAAGRNGEAVDIEWLAGNEGDLVGYRAYRLQPDGSSVPVCELTSETACRDSAPPAADALDYYVVGVDRAPSGEYREGERSAVRTVRANNQRPNPPTGLVATSAANGSVVLTWSAPEPADPDSADGVAFYRIYRDGIAYEDRYDRTGDATQLMYTDTDNGGTSHTYRVTAVDGELAESSPAGPVTR